MAEKAQYPTAERGGPRRDPAAIVLKIVRDLSLEVQPGQLPAEIDLDTNLERELGIDSLARVELNVRLERNLGASLPEDAIMQAETPAELLQAMQSGSSLVVAAPERRERLMTLGAGLDEPHSAATLIDAVAYHASRHENRLHVRLLGESGQETSLSYGELWSGAQAVAEGIRDELIEPGETVAIMLPTCLDFFHVFLGILLAGATPVPIYPPLRRSQIGEHLLRQAGILRNAEARLLVTTREALPFARLIKAQVETIKRVTDVKELRREGAAEVWPAAAGSTTAFLQYTSGSTGDPKGVILSHTNLLSNIRAIGKAFELTSDDVVVSWLPLYHDMGLIGKWMGSLYFGLPVVIMSPLSFLARPERWLWAMHRFHGTLSAAPNFAYEFCASRVPDSAIEGLDLSNWRMAGNGAEAVQPGTLDRFINRFEKRGFRRQAMTPMYGLAENAVALTMSPLGRGPRLDRVDRSSFARTGYARPARTDDAMAMTFVSSGIPIRGHEVRIAGPAGEEAGEREEGQIQFRGPSATQGYHRNPQKTAELFSQSWLNSGDTGYIDSGELFVTGRVKDIIIRAGRNIYPEEIETAVGEISGIRKGRVAAFASRDSTSETERLVVVAETRLTRSDEQRDLMLKISDCVTAIAELPPEEVVLAKPGAVLKTANGKLRRAACQRLYEEGKLDAPPSRLWRQIAGLLGASVAPQIRRWSRASANFAYAAYFQIIYRLIGPAIWIALLVTPNLHRRRRLFRSASKLALRLLGIPLQVNGLHQLPSKGAYIIAVNHQSYLDGLALAAAIPGDYAFVAKREFVRHIIAGLFLRRIGVAFVERMDAAGGVEDTRRLAETLETGQPLVVFCEGTFDRRPGLRAFHMGAFVTAAQTGSPVVPAAIRGTRSILRGDSWFARRGRLTITFESPVMPRGEDWAAALKLRDRVRPLVLRHCGEPDLAYEPTALALRRPDLGQGRW